MYNKFSYSVIPRYLIPTYSTINNINRIPSTGYTTTPSCSTTHVNYCTMYPYSVMGRGPAPSPEAALFNELENTFDEFRSDDMYDINHLIINLYLVITGSRRGFLGDSAYTSDVMQQIQLVAQKYNLHIITTLNTIFIAKQPIDPERLRNDLYMAEMLDFGCLDPNYFNSKQPRIAYTFSVEGDGEYYEIMTFTCTLPYEVSTERIQALYTRFQSSISRINPHWTVDFQARFVPPKG